MQILLSRTQAEPGRAVKVTAVTNFSQPHTNFFYGISVYKIVFWPCIGGKVLIFSQNHATAPSGQAGGGRDRFDPILGSFTHPSKFLITDVP